ncbi:MAG: hypothetical protein DCC71_24040 [Proteobacteria bacterium]|nr:MAG: hypothetical protein DCC71_24040 [Pseudomonadota bacterium]
MSRAPRVSVLMPVRDGAAHVRPAIESVLAQSVGDLELIVVDDGSRDATAAVVAACRDPRIRFVQRPAEGLAAALNHGLELARGEYVARMDHDDVCRRHRLARQLRFLDAHPEVGIAGGFVRAHFPDGGSERWTFPCEPEVLRAGLLFEPGVAHPATLLRKAALDRHGLRYDARYRHVEDWDLWRRAADCFPIANVPYVVLDYRVHGSRTSSRHAGAQETQGRVVQDELLAHLGLAGHPLVGVHRDVSLGSLRCAGRDERFLRDAADWFDVLREENRIAGRYAPAALDAFLADRMLLVLHANRHLRGLGLRLLRTRGWLRRARPVSVASLLARSLLPRRRAVAS